jgi:hypothetical protein
MRLFGMQTVLPARSARQNERQTKRKSPRARAFCDLFGAADGVRTRDNWNHNPGLYR